MDLKGTKTELNLKAALAGESIARNRYTYFSEKARKQGLDDIAEFFDTLARNEKEHAFIWYKLLYDTPGDTQENLKRAAEGEHDEWTDMYRDFADIARKEGFLEISGLFNSIARIERNHERLILKYTRELVEKSSGLSSVNTPGENTSSNATLWICGHCGFTGESKDIPELCPLCKHVPIIL